jgi:hypothetical protein
MKSVKSFLGVLGAAAPNRHGLALEPAHLAFGYPKAMLDNSTELHSRTVYSAF